MLSVHPSNHECIHTKARYKNCTYRRWPNPALRSSHKERRWSCRWCRLLTLPLLRVWFQNSPVKAPTGVLRCAVCAQRQRAHCANIWHQQFERVLLWAHACVWGARERACMSVGGIVSDLHSMRKLSRGPNQITQLLLMVINSHLAALKRAVVGQRRAPIRLNIYS